MTTGSDASTELQVKIGVNEPGKQLGGWEQMKEDERQPSCLTSRILQNS
jgi:hypothetical protein